jgi:hypothetical protein
MSAMVEQEPPRTRLAQLLRQQHITLEEMFGEPVARLLGPPYGIGALAPTRCHNGAAQQRGTAQTDWEG